MGLIIGILLTIIILLMVATFLVILRIRRGKYTPTHSLVGARIQERMLGTPYRAKMRVYGQVCAREGDCSMYTTDIPPTPAPPLSDCTDDYAEPVIQDNIYYQAFHPPDHDHPPLIPSYPPPTIHHNHYEDSHLCSQVLPFTSSLSSPSSVDILYPPTHSQEYQHTTRTPKYSKVNKTERKSPEEYTQNTHERNHTKASESKKNSTPKINPSVKLKSVRNSELKIVERLGRGQYGEVHLCHYLGSSSSSSVYVKSLDQKCSPDQRSEKMF